MTEYKDLDWYKKQGLLSSSTNEDGIEIVCYTRNTFLERKWDKVTETHRGVLYYNEQKLNNPMDKIFNINEVPATALDNVEFLMNEIDYDVYDKSNGHLFIVSSFPDPGTNSGKDHHVMMTTKASLPHKDNTLLNEDIRVFGDKYAYYMDKLITQSFGKNMTLMFEALVDHDKHTLYEEQVALYGGEENVFVLLCGYAKQENGKWEAFNYESLQFLAKVIGCPVVKKYETNPEGALKDWKTHKGIEGYVIHFPSVDFRVKVKTDEYWKIRFKKDLTPERVINIFSKGGLERLELKLPEEVDTSIIEIVKKYYFAWYTDVYVDVDSIPEKVWSYNTRQIAMDMSITSAQSSHVLAVVNNKPIDRIYKSKDMREKFNQYVLNNPQLIKAIKEEFYVIF